MTTFRELAAELDAQPYELAAFLDLGTDYDEQAELDEAAEAQYREMWAAGIAADSTHAE